MSCYHDKPDTMSLLPTLLFLYQKEPGLSPLDNTWFHVWGRKDTGNASVSHFSREQGTCMWLCWEAQALPLRWKGSQWSGYKITKIRIITIDWDILNL